MSLQILLNAIDIKSLCSLNKVAISERGTGFPFATDTQPSTAKLTLTETHGVFAKENTNNYFIQQSLNPDGIHCPIEIREDGETLFKGRLTDCSAQPGSAYVYLSASDVIEELRTENLTDFGHEKSWKLIEDTEASAQNGIYPLTLGVTPISEDSATLKKALNAALTIVPDLQATGVLDPDNVQITEDAVVSEGGPIAAAAGSAYPQISAKAPYRYETVNTLVTALLDALGIATGNRYIELPPISVDTHIEALGRIGYNTVVGEQGSSNHLSWYGHPTDVLQDGNDTYFAYSPPYKTNALWTPLIIKLNHITGARTTFKPITTPGAEIWSLAKIGNNLIVLTTEGGKYDSSEASNQTQLLYFDVTQDPISVGTLVAKNATLPVQLGCFYAAGSAIAYEEPYNVLPDTRRRLVVHNNNLFYGYAKTDKTFGVARVQIGGTPTAILTAKGDGYNTAGFAYDYDGSNIYFATTFLDAVQSTLKVVKKT